MNIDKTVSVQVPQGVANLALVKEYREDSQPIYVYDLCSVNDNNDVTVLQQDVWVFVENAPFTLTGEELHNLKAGNA